MSLNDSRNILFKVLRQGLDGVASPIAIDSYTQLKKIIQKKIEQNPDEQETFDKFIHDLNAQWSAMGKLLAQTTTTEDQDALNKANIYMTNTNTYSPTNQHNVTANNSNATIGDSCGKNNNWHLVLIDVLGVAFLATLVFIVQIIFPVFFHVIEDQKSSVPPPTATPTPIPANFANWTPATTYSSCTPNPDGSYWDKVTQGNGGSICLGSKLVTHLDFDVHIVFQSGNSCAGSVYDVSRGIVNYYDVIVCYSSRLSYRTV